MTLESCALVLLGGFLGGIARLFLAETIGRSMGETFPWGTLAVNVSGALAIGAFAGASRAAGVRLQVICYASSWSSVFSAATRRYPHFHCRR